MFSSAIPILFNFSSLILRYRKQLLCPLILPLPLPIISKCCFLKHDENVDFLLYLAYHFISAQSIYVSVMTSADVSASIVLHTILRERFCCIFLINLKDVFWSMPACLCVVVNLDASFIFIRPRMFVV